MLRQYPTSSPYYTASLGRLGRLEMQCVALVFLLPFLLSSPPQRRFLPWPDSPWYALSGFSVRFWFFIPPCSAFVLLCGVFVSDSVIGASRRPDGAVNHRRSSSSPYITAATAIPPVSYAAFISKCRSVYIFANAPYIHRNTLILSGRGPESGTPDHFVSALAQNFTVLRAQTLPSLDSSRPATW